MGELYPEGPQLTPAEGCYLGLLLISRKNSPHPVPQGAAVNIERVWKTVEYYKPTATHASAWLNADARRE